MRGHESAETGKGAMKRGEFGCVWLWLCVCELFCVIVINSSSTVLSGCRQPALSAHNHSMTNGVCMRERESAKEAKKTDVVWTSEVGGHIVEIHTLPTCVYRRSDQ